MKTITAETASGNTGAAAAPETVLVLHVKKGYEQREQHIRQMLQAHHLHFRFILDGDIADLTDQSLRCYFTGDIMSSTSAHTSCAMKHFLAYKHILEHHLKGALVLEDDAVLYKSFDRIYRACLSEIDMRGLKNALVSFEDSSLHLVPHSERKKGQYLYKHDRDRFTGAYYCTYEAAALIMHYVETHKCHLPIDRFHAALINLAGLNYYWCHPCIATQGTHSGCFRSSISTKSAQRQPYRRLSWPVKLAYRSVLAMLR